ncbi:MAG: response regulator [Nitratireductor sp.]
MKIFMVVDDSPVIRKIAKRLLEDLGMVVVEAGDTVQAQNMCAESMPDGILLDWYIPGSDVFDFLNWVSPKMKEVDGKILFCTSEILVSEMTKAKRSGVNGFLLKPFNRPQLEEKLIEVGLLSQEQFAA